MKLPEPAPDLRTLISWDSGKLVSLLTSDEARKYVEKANQEYLHWEKAKYLTGSASFSPEELWFLIKLSRTANIKAIPLSDPKSNSFGFWLPDPVLKELHRYLARKQGEMQKAIAMLRNVPNLNYRQIALLQHAVKHAGAVYTIESHKNSHNVVRATARADLFDLVERGYLNKRKLTRRYSFETVPDVVRKLDLPPPTKKG